jgi:DNA replication initiation complex subunit (GINS family)
MLKDELQSLFIINKIKTTGWQNRIYINHILLMLRMMKKSKLSPAEGQLFFLLRNKYENEYLQLLKENDQEKYRAFMEDREVQLNYKEAEAESKQQKIAKRIKQELEEYKEWITIQKGMN